MQDNYIKTDKDLLELNLPPLDDSETVTATAQVPAQTTNLSAMLKDNSFLTLTFSITFLILFVIFCICLVNGMFKMHNSPIAKFTRQQKSKVKQKAYVSSKNRLDTPESIDDCIRLFLERTQQ